MVANPAGCARVLLVEAEPLVAQGLRTIVDSIPGLGVVFSTGQFNGLRNLIGFTRPAIGVIDPFDIQFCAPKQRGIPLIARCHRWSPETKWIAYVHNAASRHEAFFFESGGFAYVNRQSGPDRIEAAVKAALTGSAAPQFEKVPEHYAEFRNRHGEVLPDPLVTLTTRELEVFRLTGGGLRAVEIAERLCIAHATVERYREHIRYRLGLDGVHDLYRASALWVGLNV